MVEPTAPPPLESGPNPSFVFSGGPNTFLYGNDALLVALPKGSTLRPSDPQRGLAGGVKFGWWRTAKGNLAITTTRLDAKSDPQPAEVGPGYGDAGFLASVIHFPSAGCWQVKGSLSTGRTLTFVVNVAEH